MKEHKLKEIRSFCEAHKNQKNIDKYNRYFKNGFKGYGIDQKIFENQITVWTNKWDKEFTIDDYLILGNGLIKQGSFEEVAFAIHFLKEKRDQYTEDTLHRIGLWFDIGIDNWASTDVLCMIVLSNFIIDKIVDPKIFMEWHSSESEWKRRAVPVTLNQLVRKNIDPILVLEIIDPQMMDSSTNVQKGLGTLLRTLWKKHPKKIEQFLLKWKNECPRTIIQYATEKMTKEHRLLFRKGKSQLSK